MKLKQIKQLIDDYFEVDIAESSRKHKVSHPRFLYFYLAYNYSEEYVSLRLIGLSVGVDHATVIYGKKEHENMLKNYAPYRERVQPFLDKFFSDIKLRGARPKYVRNKTAHATQIRILTCRIRNMKKELKRLEKLSL
jgi:hypothetical protein